MTGREPFRGWWIVGVGFASQAVAIGFSIMTFTLFVPLLVEEFDSSRGQVTLGLSTLMVVMTGVGPILGRLLDRRSIRGIMVAGAALFAACLAAMPFATALWQLGLLYGVGLAVGTAMLGPLASSTVVAKWFRRKLGRAQGLTNMGGPAGGLLFAPITGVLLARFGWRATVGCFAATTLLVIPAVWAAVRNRPSDLGQHPDGEPAAPEAAGEAHAGELWSTARLVRARAFWCMALPVGLLMSISTAWTVNFAPFAADLGVGTAQASLFIGVGAGIGILGTLLFGALADRFDGRSLLWTLMGLHAAGFAYLRTLPGQVELLAMASLIGVAGGGMMPVYASLISRIFGPSSFGSVMGLAGLVMVPFFFAMPPLAASLRDASGSYVSAFGVFIAALGVAAGILGLLRVGAREPVAVRPAEA